MKKKSRFFRPALLLTLGAVVIGLALTVGFVSGAAPEGAPAAPPAPEVTAALAIARDIAEWDDVTGRLEAVDVVEIRPRVSGFIAEVAFEEGALVRRGQLLFRIDPRPFQAQVDRLSAELDRARARVAVAASELARAKRLAGQNAMSLEEQERRAAASEESTAALAAVDAALRAARLDLEFTRVTSPINGRISRAIVTEGNLVSSGPGEATLLTTVVSLDPIYASFDMDERTYLQFAARARDGGAEGVPIRMAVGADAALDREGVLNFLDNRVDPSTGTVRGRALFKNPDRALTPGLFVRLRLVGSSRYQGVLVQDRAVGTDLDKRFVYVVGNDQSIEYRAVTLGPLVDGLRVVRDGLSGDELVVVNGLQRVRPGVKVAPQVVAMEPAS